MRAPRLRLRTSMVLVAVTAVLLAACASLRSRALLRQRAIEAVDRLHGGYGIWISGPDWYRRLLARTGVGEKAFYDPTRVSLGPNCPGYDLAILFEMKISKNWRSISYSSRIWRFSIFGIAGRLRTAESSHFRISRN